MNTLVIVESPSKIPAIKSFLGKGYKVVACKGHVRDLPKSRLGIDIEDDFNPQYINIRGKGELINSLKSEAKKADKIILATDPDREGEAISWHLVQALGEDEAKFSRISFNEITKSSFKEAIKNPRDLDMGLVDSQQARRVLDRLVGYKISPFLWKKIKSGLSAGRVQSVATRIIVEREEEINNFDPKEYWSLTALLATHDKNNITAKFFGDKDKKIELTDKEQVDGIIKTIDGKDYVVSNVKKAVKTKRALPPFITSSLQQEAGRRLNFRSQRIMRVAQELYEGINIGNKSSTQGLITYMRTDSLRISTEAMAAAKSFIVANYGEEFYPKTPNFYKSKKSSQDAHEAIRPTDPGITPDSIKQKLSSDQYRLYKLIWERFMASQMSAALFDTVTYDFLVENYLFRASGETVKFQGYRILYEEPTEDTDEENNTKAILPTLKVDEVLKQQKLTPKQHFTQPPPRYTEGSLVRVLEEKGIGRPSTYTPTITTIIARNYVKREGRYLVPTELGFVTTDLMKTAFAGIVDYSFTAKMEEELDKIENRQTDYLTVVREFYTDFAKQLTFAEENMGSEKIELETIKTDFECDKCGATMIVREGRYGKFAACPNYPACKNTRRLEDPAKDENGEEKPEVIADKKCPKCGSDMVLRTGAYGDFFACRNYPECKSTMPFYIDTKIACPECNSRILQRQTKTKRIFYSCERYPECGFSVWDIPQDRRCPNCDGIILKKKTKDFYYCHKQCGYTEGTK